jgi:hypothetical protein
MKARPFLAAVLAAALLLFTLGFGGWWLVLRQSPLSLQHQSLRLPLAARFVPRNAPLSLHLLVNPDRAVAYARALAPATRRREAAAAVERLRDGAFAAAGLDYATELSGWLGDETSLVVLAPEGSSGPTGWLLALRSRDSEGARRFLQRFWQTRSLAGTELQISTYRGMGLISGRGALVGQPSRPLATALINDELVLVASGRGVLEQALDVSQIDELNQAAHAPWQADPGWLGEGVAVLTARSDLAGERLGLPQPLATDPAVSGLIAALAPSGSGLWLKGLLEVREPLAAPTLPASPDLLERLRADATSVALVENPAALLAHEQAGPADLWKRLLGPLLRQALSARNGPLPSLVSAADDGPLLWADQEQGWLLATTVDHPDPAALQPALKAQGWVAAPLTTAGRTVEVWTRLQARSGRGHPETLEASVAGARAIQDGVAWWGEGLAMLSTQLDGHEPPRRRIEQLAALRTPAAPFQWAMGSQPARALLAAWQPWRLLASLSGTPFGTTVQGLALSLEGGAGTEPGGTTPGLRLSARLELG